MNELKTWGECLDYTLSNRATWKRGGGAQAARIYAGYFTRLRGRSFPADKLRQAILRQCCEELIDEGKTNATVNRFISAVSTVLNHCKTDEVIAFEVPRFERYKEEDSVRAYFTKEQVERIVWVARNEFQNDSLADITLMGAYTGMRQAEILGVKARDIDLNLNVINIPKTKSGKARSVPIHNELKPVLMEKLEYCSPNVQIFGDCFHDRHQLLRQFKNVVRKYMQLDERYCFHSLRHTFATWHVQAGTHFRELMAMLGHSAIETTLIYAKSTDMSRQSAINNI